MSLYDNLRRVQDGIEDACAMSGRKSNEITLVAVTKFVSTEVIAEGLDLGIRNVGENRAQELSEKLDFFKSKGCKIHFIGQLQTNKVKYIIGNADLIQSVDRIQLAHELERQASLKGIKQEILIQVNIGEEAQKGGISKFMLEAFLADISDMPHLKAVGLMCIPPALGEENTRPYFAAMRDLFENCNKLQGITMRELSMGMSNDYKAAIIEGATMVRVGSALFGRRM
ncbi:MAG: hypothetical protein BWY62_00934 [Firmicutes bacterium ADurb.Bin356]|nr:MAG: hypothetical protein BWY62_00934 [Firmicutes bacterium ADurb.Bin356]